MNNNSNSNNKNIKYYSKGFYITIKEGENIEKGYIEALEIIKILNLFVLN